MFVTVTPLYDYPLDTPDSDIQVNTRYIQRAVRLRGVYANGAVGRIFMLGVDQRIFHIDLGGKDMAAVQSAIKTDNIVDQANAELTEFALKHTEALRREGCQYGDANGHGMMPLDPTSPERPKP